MNKIKYFIYTILISIIIFFIFDFIQFKIIEKNFFKNFEEKHIHKNSYFKYYDNNWFTYSITSYKEHYEKITKKHRGDIVSNENTKPPILLFGCSFAFGTILKEDQTFAYKLSHKTKRNVHNKSIEGCGIQHTYYLLNNDKFYKTLPSNPEYAIYVYIPNQFHRLNKYIFPDVMLTNGPYLHYDLKDNKLKLRREFIPIYKSFLAKNLLAKIDEINSTANPMIKEYIGNVAIELFKENRRLLKEKFPNIKFVILRYISTTGGLEEEDYPEMWAKLENEGFIIINSKDLVGRIFTVDDTTDDKCHPSENAWDLLVPPFIEKLNL